jgi:hypothetical protein
MDPVNLKTLAQFILLGDPSLQPAAAVGNETNVDARSFTRAERRAGLKVAGDFLQATKAHTLPSKSAKPGKNVRGVLERLAKKTGMKDGVLSSFRVRQGPKAPKAAIKGATSTAPSAYHVVLGGNDPLVQIETARCIVAKEVGRRIVNYREYVQK